MENELKFAVLIDSENISDKYIKIILDEISKHGIATIKRIYGDWTKPQKNSWKNVTLDYSLLPVQQYSYTIGKNASDSALIIDAMDILYTSKVDGFCIVSSDSDFTRLAARLREAGMMVIGMGESKTAKAFIAACNQFKYLDILYSNNNKAEITVPVKRTVSEPKHDIKHTEHTEAHTEEPTAEELTPVPQTDLDTIKKTIVLVVEEGSDEDGWMFSGELGNQLAKRYPDFDVRNFGYAKLTPFIKSLGMFDIKSILAGNSANIRHVYIRLKQGEGKASSAE